MDTIFLQMESNWIWQTFVIKDLLAAHSLEGLEVLATGAVASTTGAAPK